MLFSPLSKKKKKSFLFSRVAGLFLPGLQSGFITQVHGSQPEIKTDSRETSKIGAVPVPS